MLLPVRTVGVMGDGRTYDSVVALRAVTSVDGMTADFYPYDMSFLARTATRIINEVKGVNRVVYDVTSEAAGDDRVGVRARTRAALARRAAAWAQASATVGRKNSEKRAKFAIASIRPPERLVSSAFETLLCAARAKEQGEKQGDKSRLSVRYQAGEQAELTVAKRAHGALVLCGRRMGSRAKSLYSSVVAAPGAVWLDARLRA